MCSSKSSNDQYVAPPQYNGEECKTHSEMLSINKFSPVLITFKVKGLGKENAFKLFSHWIENIFTTLFTDMMPSDKSNTLCRCFTVSDVITILEVRMLIILCKKQVKTKRPFCRVHLKVGLSPLTSMKESPVIKVQDFAVTYPCVHSKNQATRDFTVKCAVRRNTGCSAESDIAVSNVRWGGCLSEE